MKITTLTRLLAFFVLLAGTACRTAPTQPATRITNAVGPLVIGDTFTVDSATLGEKRRINVYLPAAYTADDTVRLPVLYMPDGGIGEDFLHIAGLVQISSLNGTMRPFLLVGIENTERRRDLTGPTQVEADREIAPRVGGSAAFRAFIRDELKPRIESSYRTTDESAIVGESLAGLFVVETLLLEPDLFDTYIAVDPSLWWNDRYLVAQAPDLLRGRGGKTKTLYLAVAGQSEIVEITSRFAATLEDDAPPGLNVHYAHLAGEEHLTIYHPAALEAFRTVLGPASESTETP